MSARKPVVDEEDVDPVLLARATMLASGQGRLLADPEEEWSDYSDLLELESEEPPEEPCPYRQRWLELVVAGLVDEALADRAPEPHHRGSTLWPIGHNVR